MFRLDKVFLTRHSSVLAALFKSPAELYDDVPLFALEDDAEVMEDLFKFVYNPACVASSLLVDSPLTRSAHSSLLPWFGERSSNSTVARVEVLLDVAKKYEVNGVQSFVLHYLERDWPTTLVGWLRQHGEMVRLKELWLADSTSIGDADLDDMYPDPAVAIRIGLDHNIPSILPAAFYCLSEIDIEEDWDRWHTSEWKFSRVEDGAQPSNPLGQWKRTARWSKVDKDSLLRVLLGQRGLRARRSVLPRVYDFDKKHDTSTTSATCKAELDRLRKECRPSRSGNPEPLQTLVKMLTANRTNTTICDVCHDTLRANLDAELQKLWNDLPYIFSLRERDPDPESDSSKFALALNITASTNTGQGSLTSDDDETEDPVAGGAE